MPRFAILHHQTPPTSERPTHWDVMLEHEGALLTWATASEPQLDATLTAERLADHRLHYLDYEGPVSGERGWVTQWDAGEFEWLAQSEQQMTVRLAGRRIVGVATFSAVLDEVESETLQRWSVSLRKS